MRSGNDPIRYKPVRFWRGRRHSIDGMPIAHIELHQFAENAFSHRATSARKIRTIKLKNLETLYE
jgi:hypothetical protein